MKTNCQELTPLLQAALDHAVAEGAETAMQLAIYHGGELVVNLCAGQGITTESLFPLFSTGKGIASTLAHIAVERGYLDYDTRLADLWPEFAVNGKQDIRLWMVLSHRTGLHILPKTDSQDILGNWTEMCAKMAEATPAWPPGGKCGYQGITFAWLLGETLRRATGRTMNQLLHDEILHPLHREHDFFWGLAKEETSRYVHVDTRLMLQGQSWCASFIENPALLYAPACIPSANGVGTAEFLARHYSALISEVDGYRLLPPNALRNAIRLCRDPKDPLAPDSWAKFALGYALCGPFDNMGCRFGHGGALGAEGFADLVDNVAIGFTKNCYNPSHPNHAIRNILSDILGLPPRVW